MLLRFSGDILDEIQKQIDAMIEDIDADKDIITATADAGMVPHFLKLKKELPSKHQINYLGLDAVNMSLGVQE